MSAIYCKNCGRKNQYNRPYKYGYCWDFWCSQFIKKEDWREIGNRKVAEMRENETLQEKQKRLYQEEYVDFIKSFD